MRDAEIRRRFMLAWALTLTLPSLWLATSGCEKSRPDRADYGSGAGAGGAASGLTGIDLQSSGTAPPPALDAPGLCGNEIIGQVVEKPNLYFVIDRSASMDAVPEGSSSTTYDSVRNALGEVLLQIGHRVSYGAAVFPNGSSECGAVIEVLETREGDSIGYALQGEAGPVLTALLSTLARIQPGGATPTAATLRTLAPLLTALPGRTYVILATDGEPNCSEAGSCPPEECLLVQEEVVLDGETCSMTRNCCDSALYLNGPDYCLDTYSSIEEIRSLANDGISTFVVGLPGTTYSDAVLRQMAIAGETTQSDDGSDAANYFPVVDATSLTAALREITTSVVISCDIELQKAPPVPSTVNLYFDGIVLPSDPENGWVLVGSKEIEIRGKACERLSQGDVYQVQIVAGCPTVVL